MDLEKTRNVIFSDGHGENLSDYNYKWTQNKLKKVQFYLVEFIALLRHNMNGVAVRPTKTENYLMGLQKAFLLEWKYKLLIFSGFYIWMSRRWFDGSGRQKDLEV